MANVKTLKLTEASIRTDGDANVPYGPDIPSIDLRYGGQWGVLPRIGGVENDKPIHEWMHEQSYMRRDLIPIVLETPKFFDYIPNPNDWKAAIKAMIETHAKTIEGLNASLTVETNEKELGLSGANFKEITNVNREGSSVTINVTEKYGNPFETLLDVWIRYGMMDPDLKAPLITRVVPADQLPKAWTADMYTMTTLFIEPDPLLRNVVHAWIVSNQFPTSNPDITGSKDKSAARSIKEMSIELGGFALPPTNKRVRQLAQLTLNNLQLWSKDPEDILLPANDVEAGISSLADMNIYYEGVKAQGAASQTDSVNA